MVIGYVLLISMAVAMSIIVYQWLSTYVPKDTPKCPDDTSLTITELVFQIGTSLVLIWLNHLILGHQISQVFLEMR